MTLQPNEIIFWKQVYIEALKAGRTPPKFDADEAIVALRMSLPLSPLEDRS